MLVLFEVFAAYMNETDDLVAYLDYVLTIQDYIKPNEKIYQMVIDTFSIVTIHISLQGNASLLIDKINSYGFSTVRCALITRRFSTAF